jgi:hypothetical protein
MHVDTAGFGALSFAHAGKKNWLGIRQCDIPLLDKLMQKFDLILFYVDLLTDLSELIPRTSAQGECFITACFLILGCSSRTASRSIMYVTCGSFELMSSFISARSKAR